MPIRPRKGLSDFRLSVEAYPTNSGINRIRNHNLEFSVSAVLDNHSGRLNSYYIISQRYLHLY